MWVNLRRAPASRLAANGDKIRWRMPFSASQQPLTDLKRILKEDPKRVVFVTGAGASKFNGLPLWVELRGKLCDDVGKLRDSLPLGRAALQIASQARADKNLWVAFAKLKTALGPFYTEQVRRHLRTKDRSPVYDRIWSLNIKGIVSFNIDKLPLDSYSAVRGTSLDHATASNVETIIPYLQGPGDFLFLPHGIVTDPATWVFDSDERDRVLTTNNVKNLFTALLFSRRVVMLGFNASDVAFHVHAINALTSLSQSGIGHFAICDLKSASQYAELIEKGFQLITYEPADITAHKEVIEILELIRAYSPVEPTVTSASPVYSVPNKNVPDQELVNSDVELQRRTLTGLIASAVRDNISEANTADEIARIYERFPRSMQTAWLVKPGDDEFSRLFGRKVLRRIDDGAFGQVFLVQSDTGDLTAAKVLREEAKGDPRYLVSFLRGVQSMRILNQQNVAGMVRVFDAHEVPTCVFMEFIDGMTLDEAVSARKIGTIIDALTLLVRVAEIVDAGHRLEERVLHRDLKPKNVMIRRSLHPAPNLDPNQIVVLDFDLSWHQGASMRSVFHGKRAEGYAAPEQITTEPLPEGVSTRNVAVDVFGFGMLCFFVFSRRDPRGGEQNFPDFREGLIRSIGAFPGVTWKSVTPHLSSIICDCTKDDQRLRPGFGDVLEVLKRCRSVLLEDRCIAMDPLFLEEIATNVSGEIVSRSEFGRALKIQSGSRFVTLAWRTVDGAAALHGTVERLADEHDDRSRGKYVEGRAERAAKHLRGVGFSVNVLQRSLERVLITGELTLREFKKSDAGQIAGGLQSALAELQLY